MINNIEELVAHSGDSKLRWYVYEKGFLSFSLYMDELDKEVTIKVQTNIVRAYPQMSDGILLTGFLKLDNLADKLSLQNGIYIPSSDFGKMMNEVRTGLFLAYGQKQKEVNWLLSFVGYNYLISSLVADINSIVFDIHDD